MCMLIEIHGDALTPSVAKRIASRVEILSASDDPPYLGAHGCDLLSDDADWDAATWDLSVDGRAALRDALLLVFSEAPGTISITALWWEGKDAPPAHVEPVSQAEMLARVETNVISTSAAYRVSPSVSQKPALRKHDD